MDHAEARELLEFAAVEPDGFDRLIAGDTTDASALAGHLAGCESCAAEMARLRQASSAIREVVRTTPPADLRERTLAFVREVGRDRSRATERAEAVAGVEREAAEPEAAESEPALAGAGAPPANVVPIGPGGGRARSIGRGRWLAAMAAAVVVAIAGTALVVQSRTDQTVQQQTAVIDGLSRVTSWYVDVEAQPDAQRIDLVSPNGGATGTVELSASSRQLVVVARGLSQPPAGQELRCWIEIGGERRSIGRMVFGGGLAYWAGSVIGLGDIGPGARFGVSAPSGETVLEGQAKADSGA